MKKFNLFSTVFLVVGLLASGSSAFAYEAVRISKPIEGFTVSNPVRVCMTTWGVEAEPAKKGVNKGKGHHHILVDVDLPADLSKALPKDAHHIHMGDGSSCKEIKLSSGKHVIRTLFGQGNHVPYSPPITDSIVVTVK